MKFLLAACMIFTTTFACAAEPPAGEAPQTSPPVSGKVLEVKQVNSYTYLRLKTQDGEKWSAVPKAQVKKGATVTIDNISIMHNFTSKTLNQTFPTILFGNLADKAMSAPNMGAAHPPIGKQVAITDVKVPKAKGANAMTVAEIFKNSASLKNKPVLLSGKVVKYLPEIMGKNWLHLRDGTGSAADNTNDILVTTQSTAKVGDVVTVKGIIHTDVNLGSGYAYKVLIEEATLQ
jgi:hypothetical protein